MSPRSQTRRDFLKTASVAMLGALSEPALRIFGDEIELEKIAPTADTCIVLWMVGGMAHTETFDPKRYAPFESGMDPRRVLSTFGLLGSGL
ncbi:MAG: twin-arginine translocation signal domain-containing protein [Chthoniobacteraceae bacterium]